MATAELLMTAEEFSLFQSDEPCELVEGRIVYLNRPYTNHGFFCANITFALHGYLLRHDIGRVATNDSGVVTHRQPDSVRGPDVAFYSYNRVPRGPVATGYLSVSPEICFEVLSPSDTWGDVVVKASEYLQANVLFVVVVDPKRKQATVFAADEAPAIYTAEEELTLPSVLPEFSVNVAKLFT